MKPQVLEEMSEMTLMKHRFLSPDGTKARQKLGAIARRLVSEESGQSMTEYILILFLVVLLFSQMKKKLQPLMKSLVEKIGTNLEGSTSDDLN